MAEAPGALSAAGVDDATLVARVRSGDRRAFDLLFGRHQRGLYYLCLRISGGEAEAQDLCQRAFLRAFESLGSFRGESSFKTWLYRIAVNLSKNFLRDAGRRGEVAMEVEPQAGPNEKDALERVLAEEDRQRLQRVIGALPEKQRATLQLRVYEDLSFAEIAKILGGTENAAKVNFHYAVRALKKLLAGEAAAV